MSRVIVHPAVVSRSGNSQSVRTFAVRHVTVVQPSFIRYASGAQTIVTGAPRS